MVLPLWWPRFKPSCLCTHTGMYLCGFKTSNKEALCSYFRPNHVSPDRDLRRLACVVSCQIPWPSWNYTHKVSLHSQDVFPSWSRVEGKVIDAVLLPVWLVGSYYEGSSGWGVHTLVTHILPHPLSGTLLAGLPSP